VAIGGDSIGRPGIGGGSAERGAADRSNSTGDRSGPVIERRLGGNLSNAVRIGDTVHRSSGPWTPTVHALLGFLEHSGFSYAPRVLGFDQIGREVLKYVVGTSRSSPPYPDVMTTNGALVSGARLLRRFHDLSVSFVAPADATWQASVSDPGPTEVICHNDWTPYNAVFREEELVAILDWDLAKPGSRLWDLAWTAVQWIPLIPDADAVGHGWTTPPDRAERLWLLCDAYGLGDPELLVDAVAQRVTAAVAGIRSSATAGVPAYVAMADAGHVEFYERSLTYIVTQSTSWRAALAKRGTDRRTR
jgi:hypothetical protein